MFSASTVGMQKNFTEWHDIKIRLDTRHEVPTFQKREVWWCAVGLNVGYEVFGKDDLFARPVLVVRKYSDFTFFGLPLTSKRKEKPSHYQIDFQGQRGSIILDQGRTFDGRRLLKKMGKLRNSEFRLIITAFKETL